MPRTYSKPTNGRFKDLEGKTFGRLKVLAYAGRDTNGLARWRCQCACGGVVTTYACHLATGHTRSCGCLHKEVVAQMGKNNRGRITHGLSKKRIYGRWQTMIERCLDPKRKGYEYYGGRGITVCKRWLKFENFYADMGDPPTGLQIDRIDNDGNYKPGNCRWVTPKQQAQNRRPPRKRRRVPAPLR